jgi:hypothetical protein
MGSDVVTQVPYMLIFRIQLRSQFSDPSSLFRIGIKHPLVLVQGAHSADCFSNFIYGASRLAKKVKASPFLKLSIQLSG